MIKKTDFIFAFILLVLALFIWLRDTNWMTSSDDTLPILVAIPLFYWIGAPWPIREDEDPLDVRYLCISTFLFLIGIIINSTLALTIGWTLLLWTWLKGRLRKEKLPEAKKLMILPLMAFPWVSLDADRIGWWFRLSGAWAAERVFSLFGAEVSREGTKLIINGLPISVEVACAGLNTLQSMLIAGSVVAFLILGHTSRYWWNILLLVAISWVANTLRIIVISLAALTVSPKFALGHFHMWGGWAVLLLMFCLSWFIFYLQEPKSQTKKE